MFFRSTTNSDRTSCSFLSSCSIYLSLSLYLFLCFLSFSAFLVLLYFYLILISSHPQIIHAYLRVWSINRTDIKESSPLQLPEGSFGFWGTGESASEGPLSGTSLQNKPHLSKDTDSKNQQFTRTVHSKTFPQLLVVDKKGNHKESARPRLKVRKNRCSSHV